MAYMFYYCFITQLPGICMNLPSFESHRGPKSVATPQILRRMRQPTKSQILSALIGTRLCINTQDPDQPTGPTRPTALGAAEMHRDVCKSILIHTEQITHSSLKKLVF